jgi:hypothetical protein
MIQSVIKRISFENEKKLHFRNAKVVNSVKENLLSHKAKTIQVSSYSSVSYKHYHMNNINSLSPFKTSSGKLSMYRLLQHD